MKLVVCKSEESLIIHLDLTVSNFAVLNPPYTWY